MELDQNHTEDSIIGLASKATIPVPFTMVDSPFKYDLSDDCVAMMKTAKTPEKRRRWDGEVHEDELSDGSYRGDGDNQNDKLADLSASEDSKPVIKSPRKKIKAARPGRYSTVVGVNAC
jgi:hypothetical protein